MVLGECTKVGLACIGSSPWGCQDRVLDVEAKVPGAFFGMGNGAVDACLGIEHGDGWEAGIARAVEFVSTCCHLDSVSFGFLWADVADEVSTGDFATLGDLRLIDEKCGTSAFDAVGDFSFDTNATGQEPAPLATKLVPVSQGWDFSEVLVCRLLVERWLVL